MKGGQPSKVLSLEVLICWRGLGIISASVCVRCTNVMATHSGCGADVWKIKLPQHFKTVHDFKFSTTPCDLFFWWHLIDEDKAGGGEVTAVVGTQECTALDGSATTRQNEER